MKKEHAVRHFPPGQVRLLPSIFRERHELNRRYLHSLDVDKLLQNHRMEAGLWGPRELGDWHGGWESPTCQLRGHFLGHWLSAAARIYAYEGDGRLKAKADYVVKELGRCQQENGGEWAGSIPPKYFDWIARGKRVWAPHYTVHKTFMGLYEVYSLADNEQALDIALRWADWFHRWTSQFSREEMDDILDVETGGMLEVWADLYGITRDAKHLELIERYDRPRLFEPLRKREDVLTNQHANTTIPEAQGAARAWEVTGDARWREIAEAYWEQAVTRRSAFCTGGQTCGEIWTAPHRLAPRLGDKNQEHCTVYNMMRLAEYLWRWTGDIAYADYWERNLYNGILAQQNPETGMIAYFLPLEAGAKKIWGTPTQDFWCCHGSLVQAHASYEQAIYYRDREGIVVSQYIPSQLRTAIDDAKVSVRLEQDPQLEATERPQSRAVRLRVECTVPIAFRLRLRMPWWLAAEAQISINEAQSQTAGPSRWVDIERIWENDVVTITMPRALYTCALPDEPKTVAFMDGPVVLAGLCDTATPLRGDRDLPDTILQPANTREWATWQRGYRTVGQDQDIRFKPLYEIVDETYTTYFPVRPGR